MRILNIILTILVVLGMIIWGGLFAVNYSMDLIDSQIEDEEEVVIPLTAEKKDVIKALICGTNQSLTDTILYVTYDVNLGKLSYMSIPRDTYVTSNYAYANKINSIYRGENILPLINQIKDLLDVEIDYYLFFDNSVVKSAVDVIGGVEIDVPMRMKYDDYSQNLHINLYPGVQVLDGEKAEWFIRFRQNNDGSGYRMGDIERTGVQQYFIKEFVKTVVSPTNIPKIPNLVSALLDDTVTNVTSREALKYVGNVSNFNPDLIYSTTAVGSTPYINNISYFKMDVEATRAIIEEHFSK